MSGAWLGEIAAQGPIQPIVLGFGFQLIRCVPIAFRSFVGGVSVPGECDFEACDFITRYFIECDDAL